MMHEPFDEWHGPGCTCRTCRPPAPSDPILRPVERVALLSLAGMGVAIAAIELLHIVAGLPGPGVLFGL